MALSWIEIKSRALDFSKKWKDAKDEASEAQSFLNDFFYIFGVDRKRVATFESRVPMGMNRNGYIDLLWKGVILIEMKSIGKNLDKAYEQAKDYAFHLEDEELPEYIMVCDFVNIKVYRATTRQVWTFKTSQLHTKIKLFADLAGYKTSIDMPTDKEVDIRAAEKMATLHDILKSHGYEGHYLEVYLVRLLFCLFADDTGIFEKNIFFDYISYSKDDGSDLSYRIARLFEVLNIPSSEREKHIMLSDELKRFAYINGSLFEERLPFADFDYNMRKILLECSTLNWAFISPAIFGAMFQGVMNPKERRELGAHYTSEENILKVIKPLLLNELWEEFEHVKGNSKMLEQFHKTLSNLKFLDPACGCGNFLIITYRELRRLELEVLKMLIDTGEQMVVIEPYVKVNVNQFYGIEYEEFPAKIAMVGMWLIDHQMNTLISEHFGLYYARLPLTQSATIVHGNALRINWEEIIPKNELNYILGNPPFVGYPLQSKEQKEDMIKVFGKSKNAGVLDYVAAWYKKAAEYVQNTRIEVAFVSTNSVSQGEQVAVLWKLLIEQYHISINFAYRTFKWSNEAKGRATVHCIIVGFSVINRNKKTIYDGATISHPSNISPYLVAAPSVVVERRNKPLCDVPIMFKGNIPVDGGNFVIKQEELENLLEKEPNAKKYIKKFIGGQEYINAKDRWCLWLKNTNPTELRKMPLVMERIEAVREFRMSSKKAATRKYAEFPTRFMEIRQPDSDYFVIPEVSSERRKYVPMGFVDKEVIASNTVQILQWATLYHFGILTSSVHMAWMRAICGRLESRYRYSKDIVYNTFPWAEPTEKQKESIEIAAEGVLAARALYPDSSPADLYDPLSMPTELVKAHNALDRAVMTAYGYKSSMTEAEIVADLMIRYQQLEKG